MAETPKELVTPGAAALASELNAKQREEEEAMFAKLKQLKIKSTEGKESESDAGPHVTKPGLKDGTPLSPERLSLIEALVEANVQRSLDTLDAWTLISLLYGKKPEKGPGETPDPPRCNKDVHKCDLNAKDINALCPGCALYRRIVCERNSFVVGGRSDICDYISAITDKIMFEFIKNGLWLNSTADLTGNWFVKFPITFVSRPQATMIPVSQVAIRRSKIKLIAGDELLEKLGLTKFKDNIYANLHDYWHTAAGGFIFPLDELLDTLGPITQLATIANHFDFPAEELPDLRNLAMNMQKIIADSPK